MCKKFFITLCLVLMLCVLLVSCGTAASASQRSADTLHSLGLFQGTGTDSSGRPVFDLDRTPTRAEAVTMLVRLLGADLSKAGDTPFTDVPDWAAPYVSYAYSHGLTYGTGPTTFGSDSPVSTTQYLSFVLRALGFKSGRDFGWDAAWELSDVLGLTDGQYNASTTLTRGDVADISLQALYQPLSFSYQTLAQRLCDSGALPDKAQARALLGEDAFPVLQNSRLEVHFIDVGQGDSILIKCDGHTMLVDGGNVADSSLIYSYLQQQGISYLNYIVCTHPHEDHVGGLSGALRCARVNTVLCPVTDYDSEAFQSFKSALDSAGVPISVPDPGERFAVGSATFTVLGPRKSYDDVNNSSIVLRIDHGESSILLMGDAESESEADILNADEYVKCDLIKLGHHGSDTSTGYRLLYEAQPSYAVISCGAGNAYGHPDEAVMSRLSDADVTVYRTDMQGDIIAVSDGSTLKITAQKNAAVNTNPATGEEEVFANTYIGNKNSHIFHLPTCSSLPMEKNRVYLSSREEAVNAGFTPCGRCKP